MVLLAFLSLLQGFLAIRLKLTTTTTTQNTIWFASKQVHTAQLCDQSQLLLLISCIASMQSWRGPEPEIICYIYYSLWLFSIWPGKAQQISRKIGSSVCESRCFLWIWVNMLWVVGTTFFQRPCAAYRKNVGRQYLHNPYTMGKRCRAKKNRLTLFGDRRREWKHAHNFIL